MSGHYAPVRCMVCMYNCFGIVARAVRGVSVLSKRAMLGISYASMIGCEITYTRGS
jgi:hypothetical protein